MPSGPKLELLGQTRESVLGRHKRHFNPCILTLALNGSALTSGSAFKD